MNYTIYVDGACTADHKGGIGIIFIKDGIKVYEYSKHIPNATNNRCELLAVIYALNAFSKPVDSITVYSDSQYVVGTITKNWKRKKNVDLWNLYDYIYDKVSELCSNISFIHIRGHQGNIYNEQADKLAVEASHEIPDNRKE